MEELLNEVKQYRKEQAELFEWTKKNGHPKMAFYDEGGLNTCDKIIAIIERAKAKTSDENGNCNKPDVNASALEKLKIALKALNDIYNFDRDMEYQYGDPGERAMRALEAIDKIDGF